MKKYLFNLSLSLLFLVATHGFFNPLNTAAYDPSGTWNLEVELPQGTQTAIMNISKDKEDGFEVIMEDTSSGETEELQEIEYDEKTKVMTGEFETDEFTVEIEINFDEDSAEGVISAAGMDLNFTGEREK